MFIRGSMQKVKYCLLLLIGCIGLQIGQAQTIRVVNRENGKPIDLVTIRERGTDHGAVTNTQGLAELKGFGADADIILMHPDFKSHIVRLSRLLNRGSIVELTPLPQTSAYQYRNWALWAEDTPHEILAFQRKTLSITEPLSSAEVLGANHQILVAKNLQNAGSPLIRGYSGNALLTRLDGVRLNHALYSRIDNTHLMVVDPNNLYQTLVLPGTGGLQSSSDALGATIDFLTKTPAFADGEYLGISSGGLLRYSSANGSITGNYQIEFNLPNMSSYSSLSYTKADDLRTGANRPKSHPDFGKRLSYVIRENNKDEVVNNENENRQVFSGYDQYHFLQKLRWSLGSFMDFTYSFHYSGTSHLPRYDKLTYTLNNTPAYAQWYNGPQLWLMHSLKTSFYYPSRWFDRIDITTAFQLTEERVNSRNFGSNQLRMQQATVDALSVNVDLEKAVGFNGKLYYGLELFSNKVESKALSRDIVTLREMDIQTEYPNNGADYNLANLYLSVKDQVSERLVISSGVRYTYTRLRSDFTDKTYIDFPYDVLVNETGALTGTIGASYRPGSSWKLGLLLSSGFRPPNISDNSRFFSEWPGMVLVPNPDLQSETNYTIEYSIANKSNSNWGIEWIQYLSFLQNTFTVAPFLFNNQDELNYEGEVAKVLALQNMERAQVWGTSFRGYWKTSQGIHITGSLTYTHGQNSETGVRLPHIAPFFGQLSMAMTHQKLTTRFELEFSDGVPRQELPPSEKYRQHLYSADGALSWYIVNIKNSYQLNNYYSINFNLENLLNVHYRSYTSGLSAPGFNAVIAVRANF